MKRDRLLQRLAGASLLVFANKQDIQGSMTDKDIEQASYVQLGEKLLADAVSLPRLWISQQSSLINGLSSPAAR